jgi:hypothetical protein
LEQQKKNDTEDVANCVFVDMEAVQKTPVTYAELDRYLALDPSEKLIDPIFTDVSDMDISELKRSRPPPSAPNESKTKGVNVIIMCGTFDCRKEHTSKLTAIDCVETKMLLEHVWLKDPAFLYQLGYNLEAMQFTKFKDFHQLLSSGKLKALEDVVTEDLMGRTLFGKVFLPDLPSTSPSRAVQFIL